MLAAQQLSVEDMRSALAAGATIPADAAAAVFLVRAGYNEDEAQRTTRQLATLQLLAEHGGLTANAATRALHAAMSNDSAPAAIQQLLDADADVTHRNHLGQTPLHVVHRADVARLLIAASADANARVANGRRLLHTVVPYEAQRFLRSAQDTVVSALLDAGADVNAVDLGRRTCLHGIEWGASYSTILAALLEAGADPTIANAVGQTPLAAVRAALDDLAPDFSDMPHLLQLVDGDTYTDAAVSSIELCSDAIKLLLPAIAWRRRRHMLLAVRTRPGATAAAAGGGTPAAGAGGAGKAGL